MATKKPAAKTAQKPALKKAAPAKKAVANSAKAAPKPAPKAAAKKPVAKPAAKAAPKKPLKTVQKQAAKTPAKSVNKPVAKPAAKAAPKKVAVQKQSKPLAKKIDTKKPAPKAAPVKAPAKAAAKPVAKAAAPKAPAPKAAAKAPEKAAAPAPQKAAAKAPEREAVRTPAKPVVQKPVVLPKLSTKTARKYEPDFTKSVLDRAPVDPGAPIVMYSDSDLSEFRELIQRKLGSAKKELAYLQGLITRKDDMGGDEGDNRYMTMEDGSLSMEREQLSQMASRQITFIDHLEKALMRIENKTYGICRVTGKLIDKARLRAVPHATLSIEAKMGGNK